MAPISVLVTDPNPAFLRLVVLFLEERHSETISVDGAAFRASDALLLATTIDPQVMIVGLGTATCSMLGLIADARRRLPSLTIVALSQLGAAGYAQAALDAGATAFVDKDRLRAELVPTIVKVAGAGSILR